MATRKVKRSRRPVKILKRMQRNLMIVFGFICILFIVLIGRLMYIEYMSGDKYEKIVLSQQKYSSSTIPYKRGDIVDAKGTVLATSVDVYNIVLDCKELNEADEEQEKRHKNTESEDGEESVVVRKISDTTIEHLLAVFPQLDEMKIRQDLVEKAESQYDVLAKKISYEDMHKFEELQDDKDTSKEIAGIWFEKEYDRVYPYPTVASQLIGFTADGNTGVTGLENEYNSTLNGINGRSYGYQNEEQALENTVVEPENGKTIALSIDLMVQNIVEKEIADWNEQMAGRGGRGSKNTAVLVMDPRNCEVLAMATYPTFDLTSPRDLSDYYSETELAQMTDKDQMDALNNLWQNFPVSHTYEPGSTFKPFTVACGLETGALNGDETFACDGVERFGPDEVHCVARSGHGIETVEDSLKDSCNDALMQMSYRIGASNFANYQRLFGFGQRTGIDVPGEPRTDTLVFTKEQLKERRINLATNSFGQNFNTTMVQLGSAFASLINGGTLYQPHVVTKIEDAAGNIISQEEPVALKQTVSEETSEQLREYLRAVVDDGTGATAGVKGYSIGGKTGTAQKIPRTAKKFLVSFIGFAPAESPELLIYTVVDEPNVKDQAHSTYAQEITHNILKQLLPYYNISKEKKNKKN